MDPPAAVAAERKQQSRQDGEQRARTSVREAEGAGRRHQREPRGGAADDFAATVRAELRDKDQISVILATGNSQLSFIDALSRRNDIPWPLISVLHMDEYEGMDDTHPASFRRWMYDKLLTFADVKEFHGMRGDHVPVEEELARYTQLLRELRPAICVMGIGENGHLAFNDPPARFDTEESVHVVRSDADCRAQQVGEGHFPSLADTPESALSLTVPAPLRPGNGAGPRPGAAEGGRRPSGARRTRDRGLPGVDPDHGRTCHALPRRRIRRRAVRVPGRARVVTHPVRPVRGGEVGEPPSRWLARR